MRNLQKLIFIPILLCGITLHAQTRILKGKVISETGPVAGATVSVKDKTTGTSTDNDGNFILSIPAQKITLIVSFVGFGEVQQTVSVTETNVIVKLTEIKNTLGEVVVIGYTTQRKKDITGAVSVVNVNDLKTQPSSDAASQLQGRASGVTVIQNNIPGAEATVRIRGLGSFNNNNPLYVIDGVQSGTISGLNPNDIESMQVLKDAASSAIYGVRASNGVIIVTTKKGKKKGLSVSYDMYYGSQRPGNGLNLLNAQEEANLLFLAQKNGGLSTLGSIYGNGTTPVVPDFLYAGPVLPSTGLTGVPIFAGNPATDISKYELDPNQLGDVGYSPYIIVPASKSGTNWFKVMTRNAPMQSHNLTLTNVSDNARIMFSANYFNQEAITRYNFYNKVTIRLNSEFNIYNTVRVGENVQLYVSSANSSDNNQEGAIIAQSFQSQSTLPVYTIKEGDFAGDVGSTGFGGFVGKNPLAQLFRKKDDRNNNTNIFGNVYMEIDLARHFTARTSFGGNINMYNGYNYPFIVYENTSSASNLTYSERFGKNNIWIWTNLLSYKNTFGKHSVSVLAGTEAQRGTGRQMAGNATGFFQYNIRDFINLNNGVTQFLNGNKFTPGSTQSFFGKADYAYNEKYLFTASVRRDGSSKFLEPNKWGTFPAFSLGWRISDEGFMKGVSWINDLKLRGSWGQLGNEIAVPTFNSSTLFSSERGSSWYDLTGSQNSAQEGFYLSFVGNSVGKWEKSTTSNIGLDATIFKGTTEVVLDWYIKKTTGLLYNPAVQGIAGGAAANNPSFKNVGSMKNTGIDLMINNRTNVTRNIKLNTTFTFTTYKNTILAITNDGLKFFDFNSPVGESGRLGANITRNIVGNPLNTFYGYKVIGLFQNASDVSSSPIQDGAAPGRFKYADINGDKVIDENDRTILGDPNPKFTYGVNLGVEYKRFDLTGFFYGSYGKDAFEYSRWFTDFSGGFGGSRTKRALYDSWLPDGSRPNATTPIQEAGYNGFSIGNAVNSYYVQPASYFRLRNLQIGYTLPVKLLNKAKISKARIYIQGTNLFTITKYTGLDPEILSKDDRSGGIDAGIYPTVRQYLVGASINF
ncbi:MAG: TonB-dependent receptor [Ginsengibacter sp.]